MYLKKFMTSERIVKVILRHLYPTVQSQQTCRIFFFFRNRTFHYHKNAQISNNSVLSDNGRQTKRASTKGFSSWETVILSTERNLGHQLDLPCIQFSASYWLSNEQALKVNPHWLLRDKKKMSKTKDEEFLCKMQHDSSANIQRTIISCAT